MYRIAILGCENSHAGAFLRIIKEEQICDVEVVGVYSYDPQASEALNKQYGVYAAKSFDEFVGKIDGLVITARHGDNHYKYAKPYLDSKIPIFIDKPITISEQEAVEFMSILKSNSIPACGGSMCIYSDHVLELKETIAKGEYGKVIGGSVRAPLVSGSEHGGFYFYAQHMVQTVCELFGYFPYAVQAFKCENKITVMILYDSYDITGIYLDNAGDNNTGIWLYSQSVVFEKGIVSGMDKLTNAASREFHSFYDVLKGKEPHHSYDELFASIFIMNAIERSLSSGKEEKVLRAEEIAL
ncbi:MAG: Gfo/Idh/MocA family oxidoreductase [Clostridia bacterium]|nr:Gfo/Idh/MocA family oxidoreductase [Clostridia bacterium]